MHEHTQAARGVSSIWCVKLPVSRALCVYRLAARFDPWVRRDRTAVLNMSGQRADVWYVQWPTWESRTRAIVDISDPLLLRAHGQNRLLAPKARVSSAASHCPRFVQGRQVALG